MSVEKRKKEQEKTSMVVEGFLFANEAEAAQARKEAEGVKYVKEKAQMDDPEMVLRIYNKMIQQRLFDTAYNRNLNHNLAPSFLQFALFTSFACISAFTQSSAALNACSCVIAFSVRLMQSKINCPK